MTPPWEIIASNGKSYVFELSEGVDPEEELNCYCNGASAWSGVAWLDVGRDGQLRADQIVSIKVRGSGRAAGSR